MGRIPSRLRRDEHGATAVEYGLIAGLLGLGLVGVLTSTRASLNQDYSCIATRVGGDGSSPCTRPTYDPATPLGQAQALLPAGVTLLGPSLAADGTAISWATTNTPAGGSVTNIAMNIGGWGPAYWSWFTGQSDASHPGSLLITSSTAALNTPVGARAYFVYTQAGPIMVNATGP